MKTDKDDLEKNDEQLDSGIGQKLKNEIASSVSDVGDANYPASKADWMRERRFRSRVRGTNRKYLKPYLKG